MVSCTQQIPCMCASSLSVRTFALCLFFRFYNVHGYTFSNWIGDYVGLLHQRLMLLLKCCLGCREMLRVVLKMWMISGTFPLMVRIIDDRRNGVASCGSQRSSRSVAAMGVRTRTCKQTVFGFLGKCTNYDLIKVFSGKQHLVLLKLATAKHIWLTKFKTNNKTIIHLKRVNKMFANVNY